MFARLAVIAVLGLIAYGSMLPAPFRVMDDRISIVENKAIKSAKNIPEMFKEGYFHDQSYYRPLVNLTFMGEWHLFGSKAFFYNLDNLVLHIINAFLVFLLVSRLTDNRSIGFWTAFLFDIHPVQWEAVCNIPGRSILLTAFFVLSSFILFLEFDRTGRKAYLWYVLILFFLGLLCKESAGVLPFVILSYLSLDKARPWPQKIKGLWPFFAAIGVYLALRLMLGITQMHQSRDPLLLLLGFLTFLRSVITDFRLFVLPVDLHYDRSLPYMLSLGEPQAIATIIFWAAVLIMLIFNRRRVGHFFFFLMSWFALELLPVSQLVVSIGVGAGHVSTAEHFLYLACIPVFIGVVMAWRRAYEENARRGYVKPPLLNFLAGGFLAFLLLTAIEQSIYASNEYNMVKRSLSFEPNNSRLQGSMGMLSVFRDDIPDAEKHFRAAIGAEPLNPKYHIALGTALCQQGRWIEGLEQFVALEPGKDKELVERQEKLTMENLKDQMKQGRTFDARGWLAIGIYFAKTGHPTEAINSFLMTVALNPKQADAWFNLGSLYEATGKWRGAKASYTKLLQLGRITDFQKSFALKHLKEVEAHVELYQ